MILAPAVPVYDYQADLLSRTEQALLQYRCVLVQAPTGAGKTRIATKMVHGAAREGLRVIIGVHLEELADQWSRAFNEFGIAHGLLIAGRATPLDDILIASIPTMRNRLDQIEPPFFYIRDEAHHSVAATDIKVLNAFSSSMVIGITATPQRTDGKAFDGIYGHMVLGPTKSSLIETGYLVHPILWGPPVEDLDLKEVDKVLKNGNNDQIVEIFSESKIIGVAVEHYLRICPNSQAIAFFVSVDEAEKGAAAFRRAGVNAECLHAGSNEFERKNKVARFRNRGIKVLCNVSLFLEGFDVPCVETVIWAKPTSSVIVWEQGNGRAMRADRENPLKICCNILDMCGNWERCGGLPPQADRDWWPGFMGRKKSDSERAEALSRCMKCHYIGAPFKQCPQCGAVREVKEREIKQIAGQLTLITDEKVIAAIEKKKRQEQLERDTKAARDKEALIKVAKDYGIENPEGWASMKLNHRNAWKAGTLKGQRAR